MIWRWIASTTRRTGTALLTFGLLLGAALAEPSDDRAAQPVLRADGERGAGAASRSYASPPIVRPAPHRYDYPATAPESNSLAAPPRAEAPAPPRSDASQSLRQPAPANRRSAPIDTPPHNAQPRPPARATPPLTQPQAVQQTARWVEEAGPQRGAGPALHSPRPMSPAVRSATSRVHLIRQEAIPPGAATRSEMAPAPGVSSRRTQAPFGPNADGSITLDQATALAIDFNPILRSAAAQIDSARGQADQAGLWNNPRWDTNNPYVLASGPNNQYNAGFQLEIPVAGKKRLDRGAAQQQVRQATFDYRTDRMNMLTVIRQQFYGLLAQQRRVEISRELVEIARKAQSIAKAMKDIGEQTDVDLLPLSIEFQRAEATLLQAERILEGRRRQLSATIGLPNLPITAAVGRLDSQFPQIDEAALRQFVATRHPRVLTASAEIDRRMILLRRAEVEPLPNPYTGPAAAWGPTTTPTQFWYNFQFNIPVWNLNQGGRRAAAADVRDARAKLTMLQNDLLQQAAQAYARYLAARTLADRYGRDILPLALENQELNREAYEKREFAALRYLLAQRLLTESYLEYIDALEEVWNSAADLGNLMMIEQFP